MFSIRCNSRVKLWRNKKRSTKNNENQTFYKWILLERNKYSIRKRWLEKNDKIIVSIGLTVLYSKKKKYKLHIFQNVTQIVKNKLLFYWFQTKKNPKLSPKDTKLSLKDNDGMILEQNTISIIKRNYIKK